MGEVTIIGLDLAKNVFQAHGTGAVGSVVFRDRFGIRHIVLLPLHELLDVGPRNPPNLVAKFADRPAPMMRTGAGGQRD